ncbi:MAG TPA: cation:proton antiporter [Methanocella sp.]|nr:cation:proton antiporter [Methanocella sp.]
MENEALVLETLLTICLLLFAAKVGGEIARRLKVARVVGELLAGVLLAPTLLGGAHLFGVQLININDAVYVFAQLGAVMLLFLVGLETKFADFKKSGVTATITAIGGVIVPFILGYGLVICWGYSRNEALLVGAALTATSIAITVKVLKDIGRDRTKESNILVGAAVIDDVLGLIVLAIVLGLVRSGSVDIVSIAWISVKYIGFWVIMTLFGVFVVSKIIDQLCDRDDGVSASLKKGERGIKHVGAPEASILAMCFGFAYISGLAGLSLILGAFAAGMSVAETKILSVIYEMTEKVNFLMAPLFFVVTGTLVDLSGLTINSLIFAALLILLAMIGKIIGCGIPVLLKTRDMKQAIIVGLGMMSRGEVGLIVAGMGAASRVFSNDVFSAVVLMVVVTTIVTPVAMTSAYKILKMGPVETGKTVV